MEIHSPTCPLIQASIPFRELTRDVGNLGLPTLTLPASGEGNAYLANASILSGMPSYRLGQAAKTLGISVDTVRRMVDDGRLIAARSSGGQRLIDGESLAAIAKPKRDRREVAVKQSARNRFPGIITRVIKDRVAAQVEIQAGPHRLVSLLTRA